MKTFISASDIETLAAQGARELTVDEDTVLTSVARETAARLGVKLVAPGASGKAASGSGTGAGSGTGRGRSYEQNPAPTDPGKPRGCQHGPLTSGAAVGAGSPRPASSSAGGPVVDELIGAVKQMARK